jgi:hypothetical protein
MSHIFDPPSEMRGRGDERGQHVALGTLLHLPARVTAVAWEPWWDEGMIARHYGVSTRTIRRWRRIGMPSRVFGGVRRYRLSDCEGWHEQRRSE